MSRPRIAIVSPFIDKLHGTERNVAECIERLAGEYEIHVYSNRVEDVDLSRITWRRIPALPGPHLFAFLWWIAANHLWRWSDRWLRGLAPDVVYSPGINCLDADAITVHVVFARLLENVRGELRFSRNPARAWPRVIHRRLYYRLVQFLERRVYRHPNQFLGAVSQKVAKDVAYYYGRTEKIRVVYTGIDHSWFNPVRRAALRPEARAKLGLAESNFALLLIGNGWKNKGLPSLLEAAGILQDPQLVLLVAGEDDTSPYQAPIQHHHLTGRVQFLPPRRDVEFFYAAADAYAGPSLEDSFGQPPAEAMACGLPVIVSRNAGCAEIISHGEDGLVLEDPRDVQTLAAWIRRLMDDAEFRRGLAENAARTAQKLTWEVNAAEMKELFEQARRTVGDPRVARGESSFEKK
jgi:UDP-glucose:(heptosyl)LPS alpha-1,3-glucosyltransferase